jgi:hypothetical protein
MNKEQSTYLFLGALVVVILTDRLRHEAGSRSAKA